MLVAAAGALGWQQVLGAGVRAEVSAASKSDSGRRELHSWPDWVCRIFPKACGSRIECPVVAPVEDLDLERFVEKSWFVQKQQVNGYQDENQLFCVTATYEASNSSAYISVTNYANNDEVNGAPQSSGGGGVFSELCAKPQGDSGSGELKVAPCVFKGPLFNVVGGPYWVVAVADDYSWALVSGGQPTVVKSAADPVLCTTKTQGINGSGLWLFSRDQLASPEDIAAMEKILLDMGVYTGDLIAVPQTGCLYNGTKLKL